MTREERKQTRAEFARVVGEVRRELFSCAKDLGGFAIVSEHNGKHAEISTTLANGPRIEIFAKGAVKLNGQPQENAAAALAAAKEQIAAAKNNRTPRP